MSTQGKGARSDRVSVNGKARDNRRPSAYLLKEKKHHVKIDPSSSNPF